MLAPMMSTLEEVNMQVRAGVAGLATMRYSGTAVAVVGVCFVMLAILAPAVLATVYRAAGPGTMVDIGPAARLGAGVYGGLVAGWGVTIHVLGRQKPAAVAVGLGLVS